MSTRLLDYSAYIFDLDGCVYFGDEPAPGMSELTALLRSRGAKILFLSNNSTHGPEAVRDKLAGMGVEARTEDVYLASALTGRHILERYGPSRICAAGSEALGLELARHGHTLVELESGLPCRILVMGRDFSFSIHRLRHCVDRVEQGAHLYATNVDTYQPTSRGGRLPETGALVAAVTAITEVHPRSVGKPNPYAFNRILEDQGLKPGDCLMIGDNPATDILGAHAVGMDACWLSLRREPGPAVRGAVFSYSSSQELHRAVLRAVEGAVGPGNEASGRAARGEW